MSDGWGGYWTEAKLDILRKYLGAFTTASQRAGTTVYLDLFAGTLRNRRPDTGEEYADRQRSPYAHSLRSHALSSGSSRRWRPGCVPNSPQLSRATRGTWSSAVTATNISPTGLGSCKTSDGLQPSRSLTRRV